MGRSRLSLSKQELNRVATEMGVDRNSLEKLLRLAELLESLRNHPFLESRIVLKGGTALNLFVFDLPRLSVDIDLNYIGARDRETMLAERPELEQAIQEACGYVGLEVKRVPSDHAGGKWRLSYRTVTGRSSRLELDMNYMLRTPLWPHAIVDCPSSELGAFPLPKQVPVLDVHELAAGKLAALFGRKTGRDLFDTRQLLQHGGLDQARLRLGFVVYGAAGRRDWRQIDLGDVDADPDEVERKLLPMLRSNIAPERADIDQWIRDLAAECRDLLSVVFPLEPHELEFLDALYEHGEIVPELLTDDARLQGIIKSHPSLLWRVQTIRRRQGQESVDEGAREQRV